MSDASSNARKVVVKGLTGLDLLGVLQVKEGMVSGILFSRACGSCSLKGSSPVAERQNR